MELGLSIYSRAWFLSHKPDERYITGRKSERAASVTPADRACGQCAQTGTERETVTFSVSTTTHIDNFPPARSTPLAVVPRADIS